MSETLSEKQLLAAISIYDKKTKKYVFETTEFAYAHLLKEGRDRVKIGDTISFDDTKVKITDMQLAFRDKIDTNEYFINKAERGVNYTFNFVVILTCEEL